MPDNNIYMPTSTTKDTFTLYGCGKFCEESICLDRTEATMLAVLLVKWLAENKPKEDFDDLMIMMTNL